MKPQGPGVPAEQGERIDVTAFPATPDSNTWSSSLGAGTGAWMVSFAPMGTFHADGLGYSAYVRCVSGNPVVMTEHYTIANGVVTDNATKLHWQQAVGATGLHWSDAASYCEGLTLDGTGGWRLPTINELQTIVDRTKSAPAIDLTVFPGTPIDLFWSSSPLPDPYPKLRFVVEFEWGQTADAGAGLSGIYASYCSVRCVR